MNPAENSFRTAVVGGFNRQDVLNYIETSAKETKDRISSLQKEGETAQKARTTAEKEAAELKKQVQALRKETESLRKTADERAASLKKVQNELIQEQTVCAALRKELDTLKAQTGQWESGAKAYAELKDRTATIELEARQRASAIESAAEEKAKKIRTAAEQILYKVQAGYGRLRGDVDATISHASGELGRVDKALEQVLAEFAEHDAALEKLLQSCREYTSHKPPEPLPLEEK